MPLRLRNENGRIMIETFFGVSFLVFSKDRSTNAERESHLAEPDGHCIGYVLSIALDDASEDTFNCELEHWRNN